MGHKSEMPQHQHQPRPQGPKNHYHCLILANGKESMQLASHKRQLIIFKNCTVIYISLTIVFVTAQISTDGAKVKGLVVVTQ